MNTIIMPTTNGVHPIVELQPAEAMTRLVYPGDYDPSSDGWRIAESIGTGWRFLVRPTGDIVRRSGGLQFAKLEARYIDTVSNGDCNGVTVAVGERMRVHYTRIENTNVHGFKIEFKQP